MTLRMTDSPNVYRAIEKLRARERERKDGDLVKDEVEDDGNHCTSTRQLPKA